MEPLITVSDDALTIERLVIHAASLCRYLEGFPSNEHASRIEDALLLGAEVLQKAHAKSEADYIDKRFAEVSKEFSDRISEVITGTTKGLNDLTKGTKDELTKLLSPRDSASPFKERFEALDSVLEKIKKDLSDEYKTVHGTTTELAAQFDIEGGEGTSHLAKLKRHIGEFETRVRELFDPKVDGSYFKKLTTHLDGVFDPKAGTLPGLLDERLAFTTSDSPFGKFKKDVETKLNDMREKVVESIGDLKKEIEGYRSQTQQSAVDREKMSAKGGDFEEAALDLLSPIAQKRGDTVERVGTEEEAGRSKKGDLNYSFSGNLGLVAIEARNKQVHSVREFTKDLLGAVRNRSAGFGILVVRDAEHLPKSLGEWHFDVSPDGIGYIFTHAEYLELSVKFAHARLMYAAAEIAGVDVSAIKVLVSAAIKKIKEASNIRTNLTEIVKTVDKIRERLDEITSTVTSHMQQIEEEISRAQSESTDGNA